MSIVNKAWSGAATTIGSIRIEIDLNQGLYRALVAYTVCPDVDIGGFSRED